MVVPSREIDEALATLYGQDAVAVIITLKVDTKEAGRIAAEVAKLDPILDAFLVTGDTDVVAKARFPNYQVLKDFITKSILPIAGVKDAKTLMVVTTYKEGGVPQEVG